MVKVEAWRRGRECAPCRSGKRRMNRAICDAPTHLDRARTLGQRTRADGRAVDRERGGGQVARKGSGAAKHFFNHGSRAPPTHLGRARTFARRARIVSRRRRWRRQRRRRTGGRSRKRATKSKYSVTDEKARARRARESRSADTPRPSAHGCTSRSSCSSRSESLPARMRFPSNAFSMATMWACQLHAIARHNDAVATMLPRREHIRARKHGPGPEILFGTETMCFGPTGMFYCVRHGPGRGPVLYGKGLIGCEGTCCYY